MAIYEDERSVSRSDLAAWLRQLADQLDSDGQVFYGAGGRLAVADLVQCELEIEQEDSEISVEIEFSWTSSEDGPGTANGEADDADAGDDKPAEGADSEGEGDEDDADAPPSEPAATGRDGVEEAAPSS